MNDELNHNLKEDKKTGRRIHSFFSVSKQKRRAFAAACFMLIFSALFFAPIDLYLHNSIDYNVALFDVAAPFLVASVIFFIAAVLILPFIFRGMGFDILTLIICGVTFALYFQTLFLNGRMTQMTGDHEHYSETNVSNILNWVIWLGWTFLPLFIWKGLRDSKKYKDVKWEKGIICASVVVVGMQVVGIASVLPEHSASGVKNPYYLSYEKSFELSSQENICVFVLDRLDVRYMNEALNEYPELYELLDGFTFYENNTSVYSSTFPSVPHMLTGEYYDPDDTCYDYWDKAWGKKTFIDVLRENGFSSTMLVSRLSSYGDFEQMRERADNLKLADTSQIKINHPQIFKAALTITLGRITPYIMKDSFVRKIKPDFSNAFVEWELDDVLLPMVGDQTDINFYKRLKTAGLRVQDSGPAFSFTHFNCSHDGGYYYDPEIDDIVNQPDSGYLKSTHGSFAILNEYFSQMKDLGIYDNSTIILLADHSRRVTFGNSSILKPVDAEMTSALLIKPKNSRGNLKTDKISELSNDNLRASVLDAAGIPHEDFGLSYFDIIHGGLPQKRTLILNLWNGLASVTPKGIYEITGDANNFDNWKYTTYELD